ncbi:BC1881 family protein [Bacillus wiedmannii]
MSYEPKEEELSEELETREGVTTIHVDPHVKIAVAE